MRRSLLPYLLLPVLVSGCLPPAKTACRTPDDCAQGRVCVEGICRSPGQDAATRSEEARESVEDAAPGDSPQAPTTMNGPAPGGPDSGDDAPSDASPEVSPRGVDAGLADRHQVDPDAEEQPPPSCRVPLACPGGLSCCEHFLVPGGTFLMGRSAAGNDACPAGVKCEDHEQPEHPATVSTFALDAFETTVGRFRAFVQYLQSHPGWQPAYGAGAHPRIPNSGWNQGWTTTLPSAELLKTHLKCSADHQTWTDAPGSNEIKPINCINWFEAFAFCAWDEGRLPTESEWEYTAAGGAENRLYPWDNTPADCSRANVVIGLGCSGGRIAPIAVGSTPNGNGRWGHRDLAGNLLEWILDRFDVYSSQPRADWANLDSGAYRGLRGGNFGSYVENFRAATRAFDGNGFSYNGMGVRCARNVR